MSSQLEHNIHHVPMVVLVVVHVLMMLLYLNLSRRSSSKKCHQQCFAESPCMGQLVPQSLKGAGEALLHHWCMTCRNIGMSNDGSWTSVEMWIGSESRKESRDVKR